MLGKTEGRRRRRWQRMRWLDGIINSMDMNLSKLWEIIKVLPPKVAMSIYIPTNNSWGHKESDMTERLN